MIVKYWCDLTLRALDRATLPLLYCVLASAVFRVVIVGKTRPTETLAAFVFLTFATVAARAVRETAAAWRDYPYWLDLTEFRKRDGAIAAPIFATAATAFGVGIVSGAPYRAACAIPLLFVVDRVAARWSLKFAETAARDFQALLERYELENRDGLNLANPLKTKNFASQTIDAYESPNEQTENAGAGDVGSDANGFLVATQRRTLAPDGTEQIVGEAAIRFEDGAEIATLFLSFCPPFAGVPTFDFEQISNGDFDVETTSVQPFGVRVEAKRRLNKSSESAIFQEFSNDDLRVEYFAEFRSGDANESFDGR